MKCYLGNALATKRGVGVSDIVAISKTIIANNQDEATGVLFRSISEQYPRDDGWVCDGAHVSEIVDRDFLETAADTFVSMFNCNAQDKSDA